MRVSKVNPNVRYETRTVASWKYITVYYGPYLLKDYNNRPVKRVTDVIKAWEAALPSMPWDGVSKDKDTADRMWTWIHNIPVQFKE